ncbi:Na(+)/H(+) antiporter subunit D [Natronomonas salina]|uniref:Na(+)/H(+) antiporter subunit D n=1 Tax=Natronomonas salina TaxID=1710540 RepID=UPI0015B3B15D|nr:Na(+)/H(+) antiporter subunit D [Natronomonas salina]QLD88629.1 Na(+)/H(+) antiporter subunit D [Natronomonas salina]
MIESVPPFAYVLAAAFLVAVLPARVGHLLGGLATAAVGVQALLLENGTYLDAGFLGFDVVFLNVDDPARLVAVAVATLATAAVLYAAATDVDRVRTAFALSYVASTVGVVFAGDWLTLIFFWELMAVTSTLLVWHYGGEAVRAGFRYALFHATGGTILLAAVVVHYASVRSFHYADNFGIAEAAVPLAAVGIGINCGFIFLHSWLPDTYPRPHVASSVFLSVFTTKTAAYVMYRAFPGEQLWLAYIGGAMAVYGVFYALLQYDPRRLLTYHIQAQVGYMLVGIGLGTELSTAGGLAHMFNNVLFKALLFMAVGVVIYRTGEEHIKNLGGLWNVMPLTFLAYLIGAASITAVPGTNGFISKGMVLDEAHHVHNYEFGLSGTAAYGDVLWWALIVGAVGTFMSFVKLGYYIFFHGENTVEPADATPGQTVAMLAVGGFCLLYGLVPDLLFELLPLSAEAISELHPYSTGHLVESAVLLVVGFAAFFALKGPIGRLASMPDVDRVLFPAAFYSGCGLVWGITELWAAVDRVVMATAGASMRVGSDPGGYAYRAAERVPGVAVEGLPREADRRSLRLRASVGTSVFIAIAVLFGALAVLLAYL